GLHVPFHRPAICPRVYPDRIFQATESLVVRFIIPEITSKAEFISLQEAGNAKIEVYFRKGDMVFSCYRFDNTAVVTLYTHSRARGQVPVIVCRKGGSFYDFVRRELEAIHDQSTQAA